MRTNISWIDRVKQVEQVQKMKALHKVIKATPKRKKPKRYILICKVNNTRQHLPKTITIYEYMTQMVIKWNDRAKTIAYYPKKNFKLIDLWKDNK